MLSDLYQQKKRTTRNGGFDSFVNIDTAGTTQDIKVPKVAGLQLSIQRLRVTILTGSAGKTWQFRAKTTTAVIITIPLDMATGGVVYLLDYGPKGFVLPAGETLEVLISAAGAAARVEVEGYYL